MSRSLSVSEYQELGTTYYRNKEYHKAIDAFTEAIAATVTPQVELYDLRAGTFLKLDNLTAALKDGQQMIKLDRRNVKGYLRTGQLLTKKGKSEVALGIYQYGSRNVPVSDRNYHLLQSMCKKLERKLAPAGSLDPFTLLPPEIAEMILANLPFKDRVNCIRVSRGWRKALDENANLWTEIDLSYALRPVRSMFLRRCVARSNGKISNIILHRVSDLAPLRYIATKCSVHLKRLEILHLSVAVGESVFQAIRCALNLQQLVLAKDCEVTFETVSRLLECRPELVELECNGIVRSNISMTWPVDRLSLRKLHLHSSRGSVNIRLLNIPDLLQRVPNIEHLHLSDFEGSINAMQLPQGVYQFPKLRVLEFRNSAISTTIPLYSKIQRIVYHNLDLAPSFPLFVIDPRAGIPSLTDLELSSLGSLAARWDELVELISDGSETGSMHPIPKLRRLSFQDSCINSFNLSVLASRAKIMTFLSLPALTDIEELELGSAPLVDEDWIQFSDMFPKLRRLDVSRTPITGYAIKVLVDSLYHIKWLGTDGCEKLSGDAVEMARGRGIVVKHQMSSQLRGSRKVRDFG